MRKPIESIISPMRHVYDSILNQGDKDVLETRIDPNEKYIVTVVVEVWDGYTDTQQHVVNYQDLLWYKNQGSLVSYKKCSDTDIHPPRCDCGECTDNSDMRRDYVNNEAKNLNV